LRMAHIRAEYVGLFEVSATLGELAERLKSRPEN
jgi:hypothetical protein